MIRERGKARFNVNFLQLGSLMSSCCRVDTDTGRAEGGRFDAGRVDDRTDSGRVDAGRVDSGTDGGREIGRASCRERV